ncbi:MAG: hypothetical protein ACOX6E_04075 [Syntrophomonadaceae bacterium]
MSEDDKSTTQDNSSDKIIFPDFTELWKEFYFKTEDAWSEAFKEFVSSQSFVKLLNQTLNQQLFWKNISNQFLDNLSEASCIPSKKDLANIAELVISVEEKVDTIDYQMVNNSSEIRDILLNISNILEETQKEMMIIKNELNDLYKKFDSKATRVGQKT